MMKCKKCSSALAAGITVGLWYVFGVIAEFFLPDALVDLMPQIKLALELAPIAQDGEVISLLIGLVQVFAAAFIFVRIACSISCRLSCDKKKK